MRCALTIVQRNYSVEMTEGGDGTKYTNEIPHGEH
jgi:hypothetical protein